MSYKNLFVPTFVAAAGIAVLVGSLAIAESSKDAKPGGLPDIKLPPGWTMDDMKACMLAGTPGKMQALLAKDAGEWQGKSTMWMGPEGEPTTSDVTSTVASIMDGRYIKVEMKGEMPGLGPYHGGGIYGYDNVAKKFVSSWIDNHSTGIMQGEGELSEDGKSLNWEYKFFCPIAKKQVTMKEIHTTTGPNSQTLEMIGPDPKTGKVYKMMKIELTRK